MNLNQNVRGLQFNQNAGLFYYLKDNRLQVHCAKTSKKVLESVLPLNVQMIQMLYQSNIYVFVVKDMPKTLNIWDDQRQSIIGELRFLQPIVNIKITGQYLLALLENEFYLFSFPNLKQIEIFPQSNNTRGLCSISQGIEAMIATPSSESENFITLRKLGQSSLDPIPPITIRYHNKPLCCIEMASNGLKVASVGVNGIAIRICCTETGQMLQEVRRGGDPAIIHSMTFSSCNNYLTCTSNQGLNLFALKLTKSEVIVRAQMEGKGEIVPPNIMEAENKVGWLNKLFSGTKDSVEFQQSKNLSNTKIISNFSSVDVYALITVDYLGQYKKYLFDPINGGELLERVSIDYISQKVKIGEELKQQDSQQDIQQDSWQQEQ